MSNQSVIKGAASGSNAESRKAEKSVTNAVVKRNFKWFKSPERSLLFNMIRLKPSGINKHLNVLLLREKMVKDLKCHISSKCIWKYLNSKWDMKAADKIEGVSLQIKKHNFTLPAEYNEIIAQESEKMRKNDLEKERLNAENNKKKVLVGTGKTRNKSNSMSSVYSKNGLNKISSSMLSESTSVKISEVGFEEAPTKIRRSLRTYDKLEDKDLEDDSSIKKKMLRATIKSDELNKSKDGKLLNNKSLNQSKELEKNDKVLNVRSAKRKIRNVSESSISSDNSKHLMNFKNNLADLTISDSSSRSVTPELLRGKTSIRSVTPESISRKSNLRSGDNKDQKSKLAREKACIKAGHRILIPELIIHRLKLDNLPATIMDSKSKNLAQNKNEGNKVKSKPRGRVTSDVLVVQQSPDVPLGRRSCSNKNS